MRPMHNRRVTRFQAIDAFLIRDDEVRNAAYPGTVTATFYFPNTVPDGSAVLLALLFLDNAKHLLLGFFFILPPPFQGASPQYTPNGNGGNGKQYHSVQEIFYKPWFGFHRPIVTSYKYRRQVPAKIHRYQYIIRSISSLFSAIIQHTAFRVIISTRKRPGEP